MPSEYFSAVIRRHVQARAQGLCEYCRCPSRFANAAFHCEHIVPHDAGGETTLDNLAWACPGCNAHKYTKTHATDPRTGNRAPLFNPRIQRWSRHFTWSEDFLVIAGRTETGRATIKALQMNRTELVNLRRLLLMAGEHPPRIE